MFSRRSRIFCGINTTPVSPVVVVYISNVSSLILSILETTIITLIVMLYQLSLPPTFGSVVINAIS